jgi:hypothetical protein
VGRDPKPTAFSRRLERQANPSDGLLNAALHMGPPVDGAETFSSDVAAALDFLLCRDDGWLRVTPQEDGERVYWKWKWTGGPHINHYVMVVYPKAESSNAMLRLALKVHAVDCGEKSPVKDHYFKG